MLVNPGGWINGGERTQTEVTDANGDCNGNSKRLFLLPQEATTPSRRLEDVQKSTRLRPLPQFRSTPFVFVPSR